MQITRRHALLGATAAITVATIPAQAAPTVHAPYRLAQCAAVDISTPVIVSSGPADDIELRRAIGSWRKVRNAYEAERDKHWAIYGRCEAMMPDHAQDCPYWNMHTPANTAKRAAWKALLDREGNDETGQTALSLELFDAFMEAVKVPAQTLAGMRSKLEMVLVEDFESLDDDATDVTLQAQTWQGLVGDIRRLSHGGVS